MRLNLKITILASGRTQRQISRACDVPENRLSSIVRGWTDPREEERQAIAAALGKPADELFVAEEAVGQVDAPALAAKGGNVGPASPEDDGVQRELEREP